jgi:pyruvate,water dikinase
MIVAHLTLERRIAAFHARFARIWAEYGALDFGAMSPAGIMECYRTLEREILWQWKAPILNDFEAMIFYGLLKRLTVAWGVDPDGTLQNDLLCGEGNIRSTEVAARLCAIAREIDASPALREAFVGSSPRQALELLRTDPAFAVPRDSFEGYLAQFGVRSVEEMKLESVPVRDDPTFCIAMLQNYLRGGLPEPGAQREREQAIRGRAEALLTERLAGKRTILGIPRLTLFRWILAKARAAIRNRENQRFARAEAYDLVRRMARAIGRNWESRGILAQGEDIFYLELDEIWSYIGGTSTCTDLRGLVALRRQEFEAYRGRTPDDHIETRGEVYSGNPFSKAPVPDSGEGVLRGLGCCQGVVEGAVRVVLRPDSDLRLNGEIMVARQTDPGWIVLFPAIGALIVEKGSMLSHSAIVAREMGIPAVVGVKDATRILADGDRVRLNGGDGTVTVLERSGEGR